MFQINIDPESLKPKLPSRKDLRPYPTSCYLEYRGHKDAVLSVSVEPLGQWIASGTAAILLLSPLHLFRQGTENFRSFFYSCCLHRFIGWDRSCVGGRDW